ncbi:hypothetical protein INS49_014236 [Diaporthe citri]|uniref:uncharacterized protein n=1 Tax=Diaporthe citri TaxID=83186 RepID=UPI001C7F3610|nr:uncharacterized protein INS49_014236 [Diaporthe citri]KAG6358352.1 hypothetical protein INS49_014236 [Diaporthe citri]
MRSSSPTTSPTADGRTSDNSDDQKAQPLSAIAQQAYDRYGVLDPIKLDLMIRGIFITREDAAALPHRITTDGCAEVKAGGSHYQRPCKSHAAPRLAPVTPTRARTSRAARAPSVVSSSARTDVSAIPSDHEKWTEGEIKLLIKLRSERIGFRDIADHFPSKNQKAAQEKFYKAIKDTREPRWKQLYEDLRAQHDGIITPCAVNVENPIDIMDEDTIVQPTESSSQTLSETTIADEDSVKSIQKTLASIMDGVEYTLEDIKTTV